MIITFEKKSSFTFSVIPPLYLPFYNEWGSNVYHQYAPFDYNPFTLRASSTSGSPVVIAGGSFFGFMNDTDCRFTYDGLGTLTVTADKGQRLWYNENCNPYDEWQKYNSEIIKSLPEYKPEKFWSDLEYCTWVDQKRAAKQAGATTDQACLNEEYVYEYMKRVDKIGLPKGKLTIDDGWDVKFECNGNKVHGNWDINREKFPHMEQLVKDMKNDGFIPGLWFSPFLATANCDIIKKHPHLLGEPFRQNAESEEAKKLRFLVPDPLLEEYYTEIFSKYIGMGFMKLKLDMSYGNKREMIELLRMIYNIVKRIDKRVEVEAHIADIFASPYCDTLRINDVSFDSDGKWRGITQEHYKVCRLSSPHRILNLDHIGTNTPLPTEEDFFNHAEILLNFDGGYPCISLLPDLFGDGACSRFAKMINEWNER